MEEEMSKELAPLLGLMLARKITTRTLIKREFGIDYKTIAKLVDAGQTVTTVTILKLGYVIAHYLHLEKLKLEKLDSLASEVKKRMDIFCDLDSKYRALYGFTATFVLQQIKNNGYALINAWDKRPAAPLPPKLTAFYKIYAVEAFLSAAYTVAIVH